MNALEQLRAKVAQAEAKQSTNTNSTIFSFSKLNYGDSVHVRFINDGEANDWFWRERCTRSLQFNSIKTADGQIMNTKTWVSVPAFNLKKGDTNIGNLPADYLYESAQDPIQQEIKGFYDGTDEGKALYKKFGRKTSYVLQGFVRSEGYENKLYRFILNPELYNILYSFIKDSEIEDMPTDVELGRTFIINVGKKIANINGVPTEVKDYATSKWSSKVTPLTAEEQEYLKTNEPFVLRNFIPSKPTVEQEVAMIELYKASYNNEPYDVAKWGKIFKPDNVQIDANGNIKDTNSKSDIPTEIPTQAVAQPVAQAVAPQAVVEQTVAQPVAQAVAPQAVAEPVAQTVAQPVAQTVAEATPTEAVQNILSKFITPAN